MKFSQLRFFFHVLTALLLTCGVGCSKESRKARHLQNAEEDFAAGKYQKAEIGYLNVLKISDTNETATRQLGFIYYEQGKLLQAFSYLSKALKAEPENPEIHLKIGQAYLNLHRNKEAAEHAKFVLGKKPGDEEALLLLASSVMQPKEIDEAIQFVEKLRKQDKDRSSYHLALGTLYMRQNNPGKAEEECRKALALDPKSSAANIAVGNLFWLRKDLKQADQYLKAGSDMADPRSVRRLSYAEFKFKTGHPDEAKKLLEKITDELPDFLPAWKFQMQIALANQQLEETAALAKKILALDEIDYDALLITAQLHLNAKEGDKALDALQKMSPYYDSVPQLYYQRALAYILKDDFNKALVNLTEAVTLNPDYAEAILLAADLNIKRGAPGNAVPSLLLLTKKQPDLAQAQLLLASAYTRQQKFSEAEDVYRNIPAAYATNREVPLMLGSILLAQNKLPEAREAFEKALTASPGFYPAVEQLILLDIGEKKYDAAVQKIKGEMTRRPKAGEPWILQASVYLSQRDNAQGEKALLKAIELNPDLQGAYAMLIQLYIASNRHQEALERLQALTKKSPNDTAIWLQIGVLQQALGKFAEARDAYEKVVALNPNAGGAWNNLAYLYSEQFSDIDKALDAAQKARRLAPNDLSVADTLGWIFYRKGSYAQASALLEQVAADPALSHNVEVQFHIGMTRYRLGQEATARNSLEQVAQFKNEFKGKDEARQKVAIIDIDPATAGEDKLKDLEAMSESDPDDLILLKRLAALYERFGKTDKAVKAYEAALKKNPNSAPILMKLVYYYSGPMKQPDKALPLAKSAHLAAPDDGRITQQLARLVYSTGDYRLAYSLFQEAGRKISDDAELSYDLGMSDYAVGNIAEAQSQFKTSLKIEPSFSRAGQAKRYLSMIDAGKKSPIDTQALAEAQQALKSDPNYLPALVLTAKAAVQKGDSEQAQKTYEAIVSRYGSFTPAMRDLTLLNASKSSNDQDDYALALKARETFPGDAEVVKAAGIIAFRKGEYQRAVQWLSESARDKSDAEVSYYLGSSYLQLKRSSEAKQALQKSLTQNPTAKMAEDAKQKLAQLK